MGTIIIIAVLIVIVAAAVISSKKHFKGLELFQNFIDRIQSELGLEIPVKHCSNSAAILEMPQANMDMVREIGRAHV